MNNIRTPKNMPDSQNNITQQAKRKNLELSPEKCNLVGTMQINDLMGMIKDTINNNLDEKMKMLATKSDVEEIKQEIGAVNNEMAVLKRENKQLKMEVENLKKEKETNKKNIVWLEKQSSNKKLIFKGLAKENSPKVAIQKTCKDKLNIDVNIISAWKIYEKDEKINVAVEFESIADITKIFRNTKKLSGTSIIVERDLIPFKQEKKLVFLQLKRKLVAMNKRYKVLVRDDKLKVEEKWFIWNMENQLVCGKEDGIEALAKVYGDEVKLLDLNYETLLSNTHSKN